MSDTTKLKQYQREYRLKHREKRLEYKKQWRIDNKEKQKASLRKCHVARMENDPLYKLERNLRKRLAMALKKNVKTGSAVKDLGCSIEEFKTYLESLFQEGMSWDNHGKYGWHIDHILPMSKFDLTNEEELKKACHYTNMQPLWWQDNLSKSNR